MASQAIANAMHLCYSKEVSNQMGKSEAKKRVPRKTSFGAACRAARGTGRVKRPTSPCGIETLNVLRVTPIQLSVKRPTSPCGIETLKL